MLLSRENAASIGAAAELKPDAAGLGLRRAIDPRSLFLVIQRLLGIITTCMIY